MSLPPGEIKIKRKRTDEPVELLHIQEHIGKKQKRTSDFVFFRQSNAIVSPSPRTTQFDHGHFETGLRSKSTHELVEKQTSNGSGSSDVKTTLLNLPRRFHIYHPEPSSQPVGTFLGTNRKRKAETIFVERKPTVQNIGSVPTSDISQATTAPSFSSNLSDPQKRPGLATRSSRLSTNASSPAPLRNVRLPSGNTMPWDVTSSELAAEMQAYTLDEIGKNISFSEIDHRWDKAHSHSVLATPQKEKQPSRFKPKAPALRYRERKQKSAEIEKTLETDRVIQYIEPNIDKDGDWVVETYLRVPIEAIEPTDMENAANYGFLVLDSQAEIEEFYHDDTDSDEEDEEDDDDENAEDHYTADYPDEEVASDDEFNCNAYHYTLDVDEFEIDLQSDEERQEKVRYPWMRKS
ncbi:BgTH12-00880 [Blumeria graminis f. sp. triticale]|uniref:Transcription factor Iwr1 domain-containing protein n=4 Tax=Blumeria graminis TaxID=34373 RepID=A0A656KJW5_BLUGR|nr:hypothetical protein BGT96224_3724 [Blumeria graminis f. sp. tritici 96224]CAD6505389.1 BgTH12-00880 [Blumeria graminis f. sp. triticale]VDB93460.1 Bgt-3724 [Blumeria graminis f. sp. tritici]